MFKPAFTSTLRYLGVQQEEIRQIVDAKQFFLFIYQQLEIS